MRAHPHLLRWWHLVLQAIVAAHRSQLLMLYATCPCLNLHTCVAGPHATQRR